MKTVAQLLQQKTVRIVGIPPDSTVLEALRHLAEHNIGAVLVMDGAHVLGIFSERDHARNMDLQGRSAATTKVSEVMTRQVIAVSPSQTNEECMALMTEKRIRHLPVVEDGKVVGVLSIGDLVKDIISEQQFVIEQLEKYIHSERY